MMRESSFKITHGTCFTPEQRKEIAEVIAEKVFKFEKGTNEINIYPVGVYDPNWQKICYKFHRNKED